MSRDSDIYLNREDRVAIATELNPDLIVSVHNNSLDNKSYSGTMVLYYNNDTESKYGDITSKECAQIVLQKQREYSMVQTHYLLLKGKKQLVQIGQ